MNDAIHNTPVSRHYNRSDLEQSIRLALRSAGKEEGRLTIDDLAPIDQFHTGGKPATLRLAERAGLATGTRVLDIGGGLGGAARILADQYGCEVTVLDITEVYCRVGRMMTERTGLTDRVSFRHGDAQDLPFPKGSFDAVWTQHGFMNISDKPLAYSELARVLRSGGRLAIHEIMAGPSGPIYFPVPWSRRPELSHLSQQSEIRALLGRLGFKEILWVDESEDSIEWFKQRLASSASTMTSTDQPHPLGIPLLLGPDAPEMFRNQVRNLEEGSATVVQAVFEASP